MTVTSSAALRRLPGLVATMSTSSSTISASTGFGGGVQELDGFGGGTEFARASGTGAAGAVAGVSCSPAGVNGNGTVVLGIGALGAGASGVKGKGTVVRGIGAGGDDAVGVNGNGTVERERVEGAGGAVLGVRCDGGGGDWTSAEAGASSSPATTDSGSQSSMPGCHTVVEPSMISRRKRSSSCSSVRTLTSSGARRTCHRSDADASPATELAAIGPF